LDVLHRLRPNLRSGQGQQGNQDRQQAQQRKAVVRNIHKTTGNVPYEGSKPSPKAVRQVAGVFGNGGGGQEDVIGRRTSDYKKNRK
jgi:hypothetical protein